MESAYKLKMYFLLSFITLVLLNFACFSQTTADTTNPFFQDMVYVAGGVFQMGSKTGGSDKRPVHQVKLDDFYICRYEVTQSQWIAVMGNDGHINFFDECAECPVEKISWNNAMTFIEKLNLMTGEKYRLPSEAEWEFAARGGILSESFKYSGSDISNNVAWSNSNAGKRTHIVGCKMPNELGIFDMSGNVWEWCADWYSESYYTVSPEQNPLGPQIGSQRIIRGGSWFHDSFGLNSTDRKAINPEWRLGFVGFRLCK